MSKGNLACISTQDVPCHTDYGPHEDKYEYVHDIRVEIKEWDTAKDGKDYERQVFFHFPNLLFLMIDAIPPGKNTRAATKIANLPTGAHPIPI
jgi:hypothetical protein